MIIHTLHHLNAQLDRFTARHSVSVVLALLWLIFVGTSVAAGVSPW